MRLYMFKSGTEGLLAFVGDEHGTRLPDSLKPWASEGFVESGRAPPYKLSRFKIESAIKLSGFQLVRVKEKTP